MADTPNTSAPAAKTIGKTPKNAAPTARPVARPTAAATTRATPATASTSRRGGGGLPQLWNADRDAALVLAVRAGTRSTAALITALKRDASFSDDPAAATRLTSVSVRKRYNDLRKIGVQIPDLRDGRYKPDVERLNAIGTGADEDAIGTPEVPVTRSDADARGSVAENDV